jgi:hypothetical protein
LLLAPNGPIRPWQTEKTTFPCEIGVFSLEMLLFLQ